MRLEALRLDDPDLRRLGFTFILFIFFFLNILINLFFFFLQKDLNNSNVTSSVNRVTSRSLDIRQMKIAMTQANRLNNTNRSQPLQADQR